MTPERWLLVLLLLDALALTATACIAVAGRSLNRLQRKAWLNVDAGSDDDSDDAYVIVQSALGSLSLARQMLLIGLAVQSVVAMQMLLSAEGLAPAAGAAVVMYLLFDKLLPYTLLGALGSERVLRTGEPLLQLILLLFGPLARLLLRSAHGARESVGNDADTERRDLGAFLDLAEEEGLVDGAEESWLRGFAEFEGTVAREVMTPRVDIIAIEETASIGELRKLIATERLSRIPVIREDLDHVVGVVHLKDLVVALESHGDEAPLTEIVRPVWFVPESKRVSELLPEFQRRRVSLTIVVDEYGGTAGLVTLEDVLEEIVGEIQDESEAEELLIEIAGDEIVVSGKAEIEDLEEAIAFDPPEGEFHTVGGMLFTHLGRVPGTGETIELAGLRMEVLEADGRRIQRVRVTRVEGE